MIIEAPRGGPSDPLRDGTAIQRIVAERHGAPIVWVSSVDGILTLTIASVCYRRRGTAGHRE